LFRNCVLARDRLQVEHGARLRVGLPFFPPRGCAPSSSIEPRNALDSWSQPPRRARYRASQARKNRLLKTDFEKFLWIFFDRAALRLGARLSSSTG
jgi:hypothetical protein